VALIDQAQIQFVHERSGVERVVSVLFPELLRGNATALGVDHRHEAVERFRFASRPADQQARDVNRGRHAV
jgi:hypothetical protein